MCVCRGKGDTWCVRAGKMILCTRLPDRCTNRRRLLSATATFISPWTLSARDTHAIPCVKRKAAKKTRPEDCEHFIEAHTKSCGSLCLVAPSWHQHHLACMTVRSFVRYRIRVQTFCSCILLLRSETRPLSNSKKALIS